MQFIYTDSLENGREDVFNLLESCLKKGRVLWLLSGGSNIEIEASVLNKIDRKLTNNLSLMLADERYGLGGHDNSNYQKLKIIGLDPKNARFIDILENSPSADESLKIYQKEYESLKEKVNTIIGQLGIGTDGHIAGVLPESVGIDSNKTAVYYKAFDFARITLTLKSLKDLNHTFVFCHGGDKKDALKHLKNADISLKMCPSLILREMPDVRVYNDQIKES